jgi:hypothetical protein
VQPLLVRGALFRHPSGSLVNLSVTSKDRERSEVEDQRLPAETVGMDTDPAPEAVRSHFRWACASG